MSGEDSDTILYNQHAIIQDHFYVSMTIDQQTDAFVDQADFAAQLKLNFPEAGYSEVYTAAEKVRASVLYARLDQRSVVGSPGNNPDARWDFTGANGLSISHC
ncbi:MAG: hypothetical protein HGA45_34360 [Chloroflexales bacterium]|nr:hypothetical protein [Chloroflexales bacterium]